MSGRPRHPRRRRHRSALLTIALLALSDRSRMPVIALITVDVLG